MKNQTRSGYILILTVMLLSIGLIMVTQLYQKGIVHTQFDRTMIAREQAKQLAKGSIQIAISQLSLVETKTGQSKQETDTSWLITIMAVLNQWQILSLSKDVDGIDAELGICLMSEQGKLAINSLFDFKEKKFKGEGQPKDDMKKIMQAYFLGLKPFVNNKDLFDPLEKFLKQRIYPLNDPTELLTIKEFLAAFDGSIFYVPPEKGESKKRPVYLMDIFTVFSKEPSINPYLLSDSIRALLGLKRAGTLEGDISKRKKQLQEWLKDSKASSLPEIWDKQLQNLYGKDFKSLPAGTKELLDPKFEPTIFSVLCYAKVNGIRQQLLAVLEKQKTAGEQIPYRITRLYWLP